MNWLRKCQTGVTLIELLIALPIAAIVGTAAVGATFQVLNSSRASNHMIAFREVQTAGYWVNKDAIQARTITTGAGDGFPLTLSWTDWDNDQHAITYTLEDVASSDLKNLQRQESVNGTPTTTFPVAYYIFLDVNPSNPTNCVWDGSAKVLTFTVKAQMGGQTATRTYEVKPRPLS